MRPYYVPKQMPDELEPFVEQAYTLQPCEMIFSGSTYQMRFEEKGESSWVFLQFDANDQIRDLFCQGERCATPCHHTAAALLAAFSGYAACLQELFAITF